MHRRVTCALIMTVVAFAAACSDEATRDVLAVGTESGILAVHITSPFTNDGAVSFAIRGEGITEVTGTPGTEVFTTDSPGGVMVAVIGAGLSGALITFHVPDISLAPNYHVSLVEVADERNEIRRDLEGYSVEIAGID
jgi:hypothetical protein